MEIEVVEHEKQRLKFVLKGAGHTFCNNLKKEIYSEKGIDISSYRVDHPLIGTPTFIVEKSGTTGFGKILADTASRIQDQNKAFLSAFKKLK